MSCRKPCAECPFSRKVEPGLLGGSTVETYIGQIMGPFLLSCHMDPNYKGNERSPDLLFCAGAATFRANLGIDVIMPKQMERLPANPDLSFTSFAEFSSHHKKQSIWASRIELILVTPQQLLLREMNDAGVQPVALRSQTEDRPRNGSNGVSTEEAKEE